MKKLHQSNIVFTILMLSTLFLSSPLLAVDNYNLPSGTWRLISLPEDPGSNNTVSKIFEDDIAADGQSPSDYGKDWIVFAYGYNSKANNYGYFVQELSDKLQPGVGYWIIQQTGKSIQLDRV